VLHILEKLQNPIKSNPMPPRWMIAGIVFCWVVALSWLFYREILPDLRSNEPIIYVVDAADESHHEHGLPPRIFWAVQRNGKTCYNLYTWVQYDQNDDLFDVAGHLGPAPSAGIENDNELAIEPGSGVRVRAITMHSHYWVTRTGRVANLDIDSDYKFTSSTGPRLSLHAILHGSPRNGMLAPTVTITSRLDEPGVSEVLDETETELEPVALSNRDCVLNPLHPVQRIREIQPGQVWKCAVVDPCFLIQHPLQPVTVRTDPDDVILEWQQTPKPEEKRFDGRILEVPCRHMVFGEEGSLMWFETWIQAADGWVLKQEAHLWGETWTMTRSTPLP
jgi:hypothetical protein